MTGAADDYSPPHWSPLLIGAASIVLGTAAAVYFASLGLSLAHYDARAHLVVSRRILDSLTPGWQQIGAVWLPLPHVLNMLPVQVDAWYRSGASAIAISIGSMGVATWALARLIIGLTRSRAAALAAAALVVLNPNVLYLQSTPMTEPLLLATTTVSVLFTAEWILRGAPLPPRAPGWALVAACMTRYEALPITAGLVVLAAATLWRRGTPMRQTLQSVARLALYPAVALVLFTLNSRWTTGYWFIPSDFYVPENDALGNARLALDQVRESVYQLSGTAWVWPAYAFGILLIVAFIRSRNRAPVVLVLALAAAALLPWYAYFSGHPVRVRYGFPLILACAATAGTGLGLLRAPLRLPLAVVMVVWALWQSPPLNPESPLAIESQRDAMNMRGRQVVTEYLRANWDGTTIMMSMGWLAHYMHDLSHLGIHVRDFLHEGNEQLWVHAATRGPHGFVKWVIVEEHAEGGDTLFQAAKRDNHFFDGFDRVAEGGGIVLYRATDLSRSFGGSTGFYRVLQGSTGLYGVVRGCTGFYGVQRRAGFDGRGNANSTEPANRVEPSLVRPC